MADTLKYVAGSCRQRAAAKQVTIRVQAPEELRLDMEAAQIQKALLNLVMNAIEASPAQGTIVLTAMEAGDHSVRIMVENSGTQIASEVLGRIFEPFFSTKAERTGLGLAIARNIVRAHGGDLFLSANEPGRVCFSMALPHPPSGQAEGQHEEWRTENQRI